MAELHLNQRAKRVADHLVNNWQQFQVQVQILGNGARILDCGVHSPGGLHAGLALVRVCTAGLADIQVTLGQLFHEQWPYVQIQTDWPAAACMASQYAGWQVKVGKFFAMGSGPMRAIYGKEDLFDKIGYREQSDHAVGVLESRKLPEESVAQYLAEKLSLPPSQLTLLTAPAASLAGTVQVVARSLETALHKLLELGFDLAEVVGGFGSAPLPPVAADEVLAIGRANDAILYGGHVLLWVRSRDDRLQDIGPKVPSRASPDYGAPFAEIFDRYHQDFYKIDPGLFSPAAISFCNLASGRWHRFGATAPEILERSFARV